MAVLPHIHSITETRRRDETPFFELLSTMRFRARGNLVGIGSSKTKHEYVLLDTTPSSSDVRMKPEK